MNPFLLALILAAHAHAAKPRATVPIPLNIGDTVTINGQSYVVGPGLIPIGGVPIPPPPPGPVLTLPAGFRAFPAADPWNTDVSAMPVDVNSATYLAAIGLTSPVHPDFGAMYQGQPNGIPFNVIDSRATPLAPITFNYAAESDPGPYPIPTGAIVEPPSDSHLILVDPTLMKEWDIFGAIPGGGGVWTGSSGAVWDLSRLNAGQRPVGWTSADAAGLPIFPGLVRFDEVASGTVNHALRFTAPRTRRAYLSPANHWASLTTDPTLPPMGMRVRLKASVNTTAFSPPAQVICAALKKYGMLLADNGNPWFVSGQPGAWNDLQLADLKQLHGSDLEVVNTGAVLTADTTPPGPPPPPPLTPDAVIYQDQYMSAGRTPLPLNPIVTQGSILYIEGAWFGSPPGSASFNGVPVGILTWSGSEMAFAVPFKSTNGAFSTLTLNRSDGKTFTLQALVKVQ